MPATNTTFKDRLRDALDGFNRQEVCDYIGKSQRALTGWLAGENQPLAGTVAKLADCLDVSADWLLGLTDDRTRQAS